MERHDNLSKVETVRDAIVGRWAADYEHRAAEELALSPLRSRFDTIASCGSCVHVFEMPVTIDLGLWQFRRGRRIAWCCCFPEDQHHTHLITWHRYELGENDIMFYDRDGRRAFRVAPYDAWDCCTERELNHLAGEWRRWQNYLADAENARYLNEFLSRQWRTPNG
jgi:hypothetical protein